MTDVHQAFNSRVKALDRKRARSGYGYVGKVRGDGLIVFKPKRRMPGLPIRGLLYMVLGFVFFKGVVLAHLGGVTYEERVAQLAEGSLIQQAGAAVMQPDPLTRIMARYLAPVLR
ncbi:hypothetical protein ROTO_35110 [Roseovarius tolerans]|uniref:Uncharacterized protein n=1 Tax=Roseovarius tolerans TaxID=74031 RepID=A0A0L6CQN7_9RHOB|nr:hypothetical protein [Roseovarius tolerans]KNX39950.1 hypothetical protein ROTO_35110 [Roseovarius tolerans]